MTLHSVEPDGGLAVPASVAPARLTSLLRAVNRRIAARTPITVTALACECASRTCAEAVEVPLNIFRVVEARPGLYVVRPGHDEPLDRVIRREGAYLVVERR
jgi:hypothetical protein